MGSTAKRAAIVTLVAGSLVVLALALWKIKVVIALLFLGFIIAAVIATLVDVIVRDVDPAEQDVPALLFAGPREETS
jgi:hypothetical protein